MNFLFRKSIVFPLVSVTLVFGVVVAMSVGAMRELLHSRSHIEKTHDFLRSLVSVLALATDAETGQRGFILTGEEAYLEPYLAAQQNVAAELERARTLAAASPVSPMALTTLATLVSQRGHILEQQIALRREKGMEEAVAAVRTGQAKAAMDEIRREISQLTLAGNALLVRNRADARAALQRFTIVGVCGIAVCVLLFGFVFYRIGREMFRRTLAERALRAAHGDLEVRVAARTSELRKAEEEARVAWQRAEAASEAKSAFLSRVSHELRTPLNAILGFGQLMEMGHGLPAAQSSNLQHIMRGGRHLLDLVDDLLDLTAVESGRLPMSIEPVHLPEAITEAVGMITPQAHGVGIDLTVQPCPLASAHVTADRLRLKQVLLNLLSNAVKYNRPGGSVELACEMTGQGHLRVNIKDTGFGITPTQIDKLFAPFERLANSVTAEGTGLGLSLCKRLVMAMGGTMGVRSTVGEGSVFWFELNLAETPPAEVRLPVRSSDFSPGVGSRTILYIEDNLANLKLLERILEDRPGVTLLCSMQGGLGLDLARSAKPDLILLDVHLPDIDGREVLHRLRSDPATREIPVFILSADVSAHRMERLLNAGAQAFIGKPIVVREFLELLDRALAGHSLGARNP